MLDVAEGSAASILHGFRIELQKQRLDHASVAAVLDRLPLRRDVLGKFDEHPRAQFARVFSFIAISAMPATGSQSNAASLSMTSRVRLFSARRVCRFRIFAAKNSRKRSEACLPDAAMSAGTMCARAAPMIPVRSMMAGSCSLIGAASRCSQAERRQVFRRAEIRRRARLDPGRLWAAYDARAKLVASMASGVLPGPIIGHRPFDAKEPLIVIGNDEEERRGIGRGRFSNNSQVWCGHAEQTPVSDIPMRARRWFIGA
jgi:hypothetical protein